MNQLDDMLPEENEPQYKELIILLQHSYRDFAPILLERQQQILSRVRARLQQAELETPSIEETPLHVPGTMLSSSNRPKALIGKHLFTTLAAAVVIAMLLGTALLIFGPWSPLQVISLPFMTPSTNPNSNQTNTIISVPNLIGLSYQTARAQTTHEGFNLRSQDGSQAGVVIAQSPRASDMALKGSYITVEMGQLTTPILATTPASLSFSGVVGQANPATQAIAITNSGGGTLSWKATTNAGWLRIVQTSGSLAPKVTASIAVSPALAGLTPGTYTGTIMISAVNLATGQPTAGSPAIVPITITIVPPTMQIDNTNLSFTATQGSNPPTQTINIIDTGGDSLGWTVGLPSASWLRASPRGGSDNSGASSAVTFAVTTNGLNPGAYGATVTITPSVGSPITINVALTVLGVTPTPLPTPNVTPAPSSTDTPTPQPSPSPTDTPTPLPTSNVTSAASSLGTTTTGQ